MNVGSVAVLSFPLFLALMVLRWRRSRSALEAAFLTAMYVYLLGVARYTLLPFSGPGVAAVYRARVSVLASANFLPLSGLALDRQSIGNIVLAIPWGFLVAGWWRQRWGTRATLALSLAFGLVIEFLQLLLGEAGIVRFRSVDINDALLNSVGAASGWVWFVLTNALYRKVSGGDDLGLERPLVDAGSRNN